MASLAIIWRNPQRVRQCQRRVQQGGNGSRVLYLVQELVSGEQKIWTNRVMLEVIPGSALARRPQQPEKRWSFGLAW
jgi:hypothetical protein